MGKRQILAAAFALSMASAGTASAGVLVYNFENPALNAGAYEYAPGFTQYSSNGQAASSPGVLFNGMSGIQTNGSAFGFPNTPDGSQTAFIQSFSGQANSPGSLAFNVSTLAPGTYELSFLDAQRGNTSLYAPETFTVSYGATTLGTFTPNGGWTSQSLTFTVPAGGGADTLVFAGLNQTASHSDSDVGIDLVTFSSAPGPTPSLGIFGLSALAIGAAISRRFGAIKHN